eukprot:5348535-Ditylum_brightwellii.AAC.1
MALFWTVKRTVERIVFKAVEIPSNIARKPNLSDALLVLVEHLNQVDGRSIIFDISMSYSGIELAISFPLGLTFSP